MSNPFEAAYLAQMKTQAEEIEEPISPYEWRQLYWAILEKKVTCRQNELVQKTHTYTVLLAKIMKELKVAETNEHTPTSEMLA